MSLERFTRRWSLRLYIGAGKYIPPHLRQTKNEDDEAKTRLCRQLKGLINRYPYIFDSQPVFILGIRLSDQNMATIVSEIGGLYRNNKRNGMLILEREEIPLRCFVDVTTTLIATILSSIADHSSLLDHHVVLHAALVAALYRIVGAELGLYFKELRLIIL